MWGLTLSVEEAAEILGVGRSTVYDLIQRDELDHLRVGYRIRVPAQPLADRLGVSLSVLLEFVDRWHQTAQFDASAPSRPVSS